MSRSDPARSAGLEPLRDAIARHAPHDGSFAGALAGVTLIRCATPTLPMPVIYEPTVCFVAQGRKRAALGDSEFFYDPAHYLVASVGLPVMGSVIEASSTHPYLCLQLDLDPAALAQLALQLPPPAAADIVAPGLSLARMTPALLDAATRLVSLLDAPDDAQALAPLATREILYRLLTGPSGAVIRAMTQADSRQGQIARAIAWIRSNFTQVCRIDEVARIAGMSRSSFHEHFKAVTAMSPLEFRTQLRMQESRRLMVADGLDAATAGYTVGYDSPSQFSRDYSRIFGAPPAQDARRLRLGE